VCVFRPVQHALTAPAPAEHTNCLVAFRGLNERERGRGGAGRGGVGGGRERERERELERERERDPSGEHYLPSWILSLDGLVHLSNTQMVLDFFLKKNILRQNPMVLCTFPIPF